MSGLNTRTITEQVAMYLREQIRSGRWQQLMPGRDQLAADIGASPRTVQGALEILEHEGLLRKQGAGRQRLITLTETLRVSRLRVRILLYEKASRKLDYMVDLRHQLEEAGHNSAFAEKTLQDLGMDPVRVARFVEATEADAWVVVSASREVLEWFAHQQVPVFALFGRLKQVSLAGAGPGKSAVVAEVVRRLVGLGHRRIVMLSREERRLPHPGYVERVFLDELSAQGIATGTYNLPNWGNTREEFHAGLDALFRVTPPTALLCSYPVLFIAADRHLALRGIVAPRDISMICLDPDPVFAWCQPAISHISWDSALIVRRAMRWVRNISQKKDDRRSTTTPAIFIEGGTMGPAPMTAR